MAVYPIDSAAWKGRKYTLLNSSENPLDSYQSQRDILTKISEISFQLCHSD
jgi:hypothetical protein